MFKKNNISWNKGKKMSKEFRYKVSIGHEGQIPWNKGTRKKKFCQLCGEEITLAHKNNKKFCSKECWVKHSNKRNGFKHTEETLKKIRASGTLFQKGFTPWNKGLKGLKIG